MIKQRWFTGLTLGLLAAGTGCSGALLANLTEERSGNISVVFINNTPFRASFSFGSYDDLDRDPPVDVTILQRRVEGATSTTPINLPCRRDIATGTQRLIDVGLAINFDQSANFDQDAFSVFVNFSNAPADSDAAALPTVGTAVGRLVRLGNDYSCGDQLLFTFEQDASAPGGFRIDFALIRDVEDDA